MSQPGLHLLQSAMDATWPAAGITRLGPWAIREGRGGGQRVSAATATDIISEVSITRAEAAMKELDQTPLFMVRPEDDKLDRLLDARGYRIKDPVVLYSVPVTRLTATPVKRVSAFAIWPPLAIMRDLWAAGGIGPDRVAVMERARGPKTGILARHNDQPAGAGFVAIHENVAMIHAIEVTPALRQQGVGANILRMAAHWAQDAGATHLALAVTRENQGANALYASQGMAVVGHYHYRVK